MSSVMLRYMDVTWFTILGREQNDRHFAGGVFKYIFLKEIYILISILLKICT